MFVKLLYFQINQWLSRFTSPTKFMFCDPISQSTPDHICLQQCMQLTNRFRNEDGSRRMEISVSVSVWNSPPLGLMRIPCL